MFILKLFDRKGNELKEGDYVKKGDTIFNTRIKYVYKYKLTRDTVSVRDSIYIEKPIEVIKEVNKLTKWQRWRLNFLWVLLSGGIVYLIIKIKR